MNHSPVEEHLGYFQILAFPKKGAIHIHLQALCEHKFLFFQDKFPGVQLLGGMIIAHLVFLGNCQTVFSGGYTIFHSHQQYTGDPVSLHHLQHLSCCYFNFSHPDRCIVIGHAFSLHFCDG